MIKVLLIDDDRFSLNGIKTTLPWAKYDMEIIGEASNGYEGLLFLQSHPADLVVLDLAMPVMDGMTFIRKCREQYPNIQYVVMTFHENFEYVQETLRLGVIDYISKLKLSDEDQDELFSRIANAVRKTARGTEEYTGSTEVQEIAEVLNTPLWLCDDLCFWELENKLQHQKYNLHRLDVVVHESKALLERDGSLHLLEIEGLNTSDDVICYLRACRKHLASDVINNGSSTMEKRLFLVAAEINREYAQNMDVNQLADLAGFSRSYLSSCFSRYFGITINAFMRRKRVYESIQMMLAGNSCMTDISSKVGYDSYQYFKKVFEEIYGEPPRAFFESL